MAEIAQLTDEQAIALIQKINNETELKGNKKTEIASVLNYLKNKQSNSYSLEETLTGGTWIDGEPIYRRAFEKIVSAKNDYIPFDGENINFIKYDLLFVDYENYGIGTSSSLFYTDLTINAVYSPDDKQFLIINRVITTNQPAYTSVKVIIIIEYTKTSNQD